MFVSLKVLIPSLRTNPLTISLAIRALEMAVQQSVEIYSQYSKWFSSSGYMILQLL